MFNYLHDSNSIFRELIQRAFRAARYSIPRKRRTLRRSDSKRREIFCMVYPFYSRLERTLRKSSDYLALRNVFHQDREKKGPTLGICQPCGQSGRSPKALSYEQLGSCAEVFEANMEFARKKAWDLHKRKNNVKRTYVQACEKFFRPPNRATQEKVVASGSDCNHENREFIADSSISPNDDYK